MKYSYKILFKICSSVTRTPLMPDFKSEYLSGEEPMKTKPISAEQILKMKTKTKWVNILCLLMVNK